MKYIINGKFFSQNITGVQRYAREILSVLDNLIDKNIDIEIAVPPNCQNVPKYKNIKVSFIGSFKAGVKWEQISLPLYVLKKKAVCINLCNSMPILASHIVFLHDISFKINPDFFSRKFSLWYRFLFFNARKKIKMLITISNFSKSEIIKNYKIKNENIHVIGCAWQHFKRVEFNENALEKYGLKKGNFYFSMCNLAKNKNFKWVAENAQNNPKMTYAVSGSVNNRVSSSKFDFNIPDNMKFLGYVSDEDAKTLMRDCKAFLFPTFYEGFGMPPLEALSTGAKVVVSDTPCMKEVYERSAYYVDPFDPCIDLDDLICSDICEPPEAILNKYSWDKSARKFYDLLCNFKNK